MASGPIILWRIDGETVETVSDFDGDCNHEIKRCLLLGRKVMNNLNSIFKSRNITLPTKVLLVKAMVFPVVTYGCESWTVKKTELQRNPWADLLQNGLVGSPGSPGDSQESSPTPQFKSINSSALSLLHSPTLSSIHDHRKNHSLD